MDLRPYMAVGVLISSALYLVMVFVGGMLTNHHVAAWYAIAAMGTTYLSHSFSLASDGIGAKIFGVLPVILGIAGGVLLLVP